MRVRFLFLRCLFQRCICVLVLGVVCVVVALHARSACIHAGFRVLSAFALVVPGIHRQMNRFSRDVFHLDLAYRAVLIVRFLSQSCVSFSDGDTLVPHRRVLGPHCGMAYSGKAHLRLPTTCVEGNCESATRCVHPTTHRNTYSFCESIVGR